jgi:hypothetical protein
MDELSEHLRLGVLVPAYDVIRNYAIYQKIARNHDVIINQNERWNYLYAYMQDCAKDNMIQLLGKIFDKSSKSYPTRSIYSVIKIARSLEFDEIKHQKELAKIVNGTNAPKIGLGESNKEYIVNLLTYITNQIENDYFEDVKKIKTIRDKIIAHNESINPIKLEDIQFFSELANWVLISGKIIEYIYLDDLLNHKEELESTDCFFIEECINFSSSDKS